MDVNNVGTLNPVEACCNHIRDLIDDSIILLYEAIESYIFQDVNYEKVVSNIPRWVFDAGISPELRCSKDFFEKLKQKAIHPIFGKFIYYNDLCGKLSAIQDRLEASIMFLTQLYIHLPCEARYSRSQYTDASRIVGSKETDVHMLLNSVFVAYASVFDLLTKIAIEQFEFDRYDFGKYKKMKSADALFNKNNKNVDSSLKASNMLFSEPIVIRKIETFRNEFVHNGPWDSRCSVYCTSVNDELADVIVFSPDMDEYGNFVSSGSRNKFYSQGNRINFQLPEMLNEATAIIKNTIGRLIQLYEDGITRQESEAYTKECLEEIESVIRDCISYR